MTSQPLNVSNSTRCPKCKNGSGRYRRTRPWPPRTIACPRCHGTGQVVFAGQKNEAD